MRFATVCVLAQLIVVLIQFCPGCGLHEDRNRQENDPLDALTEEEKKQQRPARLCMEFTRFIFIAGMYVGAVAVILAIFTMTAETANGTGSYVFGKDAQTPYL